MATKSRKVQRKRLTLIRLANVSSTPCPKCRLCSMLPAGKFLGRESEDGDTGVGGLAEKNGLAANVAALLV